MAKRTLGLGKAAKQRKKQKSEDTALTKTDNSKDKTPSEESTPVPKGNEIHVELDDEVDQDDELVQLRGLWDTFVTTGRENEMVLNGVIHESDRLLRNLEDGAKLPAEFHALYALALAELAVFHTEDEGEGEGKGVKDYFDAALERADLGLEQYPDSIQLGFAKARIILSRIPLEYISQWDLETKKDDKTPDIPKLLDEALKLYEDAEESVKLLKNYTLLDTDVFETFKSLDDLLDIIQNFGKEDIHAEGIDSDEEELEDEQEIKLSKKHPLYKVQKSDKYLEWLFKHGSDFGDFITIEYKDLLNKKVEDLTTREKKSLVFFKQVSAKIGQILLQAAQKPSQIFTSITYDSDVEDDAEIDGYNASSAQKEAIEYTKRAVEFFKRAEDEEDPQTWVAVAEAVIDLGNLYDYESKEQEDAYAVAEKRLKRANNATNGKYQKILDNLLEKDE